MKRISPHWSGAFLLFWLGIMLPHKALSQFRELDHWVSLRTETYQITAGALSAYDPTGGDVPVNPYYFLWQGGLQHAYGLTYHLTLPKGEWTLGLDYHHWSPQYFYYPDNHWIPQGGGPPRPQPVNRVRTRFALDYLGIHLGRSRFFALGRSVEWGYQWALQGWLPLQQQYVTRTEDAPQANQIQEDAWEKEAPGILPSLELGPALRFYSRQRQVFIELSPFVRWQWLAATGPSDHLEAAVALDYISASNGPALQFGARLSLGLGF